MGTLYDKYRKERRFIKRHQRNMKFIEEAKKMTWTKPVDLIKNVGVVLGFSVVMGLIIYAIDALTVLALYH